MADEDGDDHLVITRAESHVVSKLFKEKTEYGLTQPMTKWLLLDKNAALLQAKFVCLRWSQTKGFIVLKKEEANSNLLLYVDLLGAMQSYMQAQNNDITEWLQKNFTKKQQAKNDNDNDDEKKKKEEQLQEEAHKVIPLQALYDILKSKWGEANIKVADRHSVNGVIEFRVISSKKKMNQDSFYQSMDDLYRLFEEEGDSISPSASSSLSPPHGHQHHHAHNLPALEEWLKKKPRCLLLKEGIGVDVSLTTNPMDDSLLSGHIFLIYDKKDGSLFLTLQYETSQAKQAEFATSLLHEFGLKVEDDPNEKQQQKSGVLAMDAMMKLIEKLLSSKGLAIEVKDEYKMHQEVLFVVKNQ